MVGASFAESSFIRARASGVYSASSIVRLNVSRPEPAPRGSPFQTPVRFGSPHAVRAANEPAAAPSPAPFSLTAIRTPTNRAATATAPTTTVIARLLIGHLPATRVHRRPSPGARRLFCSFRGSKFPVPRVQLGIQEAEGFLDRVVRHYASALYRPGPWSSEHFGVFNDDPVFKDLRVRPAPAL